MLFFNSSSRTFLNILVWNECGNVFHFKRPFKISILIFNKSNHIKSRQIWHLLWFFDRLSLKQSCMRDVMRYRLYKIKYVAWRNYWDDHWAFFFSLPPLSIFKIVSRLKSDLFAVDNVGIVSELSLTTCQTFIRISRRCLHKNFLWRSNYEWVISEPSKGLSRYVLAAEDGATPKVRM